jgi:hypothetical protein
MLTSERLSEQKASEIIPISESVEAPQGLSKAPTNPKSPSKKIKQPPLFSIDELLSSVSAEGVTHQEVAQPQSMEAQPAETYVPVSQAMTIYRSSFNEATLKKMVMYCKYIFIFLGFYLVFI